MDEIAFRISGLSFGSYDHALVTDDENALDVLAQTVIDDLSTDIEVTVGGVTMHLAGWRNHDHWQTEWQEIAGDMPVDEFIEAALDAGRTEARQHAQERERKADGVPEGSEG
jgi:hypothetical protein